MKKFFYIDDRLINLDDPVSLVKDEYREYFARKELAPFLLSEICVMDMLYTSFIYDIYHIFKTYVLGILYKVEASL